MKNKKKLSAKDLIFIITLPLLLLLIIGVVIIFHRQIFDFFLSTKSIRRWIETWGIWAPISFIGLQVVQVVIFIIPGEFTQIAGGLIFGTIGGFLYSSLGIAIGSVFNFYLARLLGKGFVHILFKKESCDRFESIISTGKAKQVFFLLFLIPGIPKDIVCYIAGLSKIKFIEFFLISTVGRAPALIVSVIIGDAIAEQEWILAMIICAVALIIFGVGFLFREQIHNQVVKYSSRKDTKRDAKD